MITWFSSGYQLYSKPWWGGKGETPPNNCFDVSLSEQSILLTPLPTNCLLASLSDNHFEVKDTYRCKWTPANRWLGVFASMCSLIDQFF